MLCELALLTARTLDEKWLHNTTADCLPALVTTGADRPATFCCFVVPLCADGPCSWHILLLRQNNLGYNGGDLQYNTLR